MFLAMGKRTLMSPTIKGLILICLFLCRSAQLTSLLVLTIFTLVNASLIAIKRRGGEHLGYITVPIAVPYLGVLLCTGTIAFQVLNW